MTLTTALILVLTILAGAAWRRWWGSERPSFAYPGYRGTQAAAGVAVLASLAYWAGATPLEALIRAGAAVGFLSFCARSVPHIWAAFEWLENRVRLPRLPWLGLDGGLLHSTVYAEAASGALVFFIAVRL